MEIQSQEILNAPMVYTLGQSSVTQINVELLKQQLKSYLLVKNPESARLIDYGFIHNTNTISGFGTMKDYLKMIRDEICKNLQEDTQKLIVVKKMFDNLMSTFDCLTSMGVDMNSLNLNLIILGYILRNLN